MPTAICPECDEEVYVASDSEQGDIVKCDECSAKLEIVGLDPIEMDIYKEPESKDTGDEDDLESYGYDDYRY